MDAISDQRVLVTGGAGFIGGHLVESLLPDNEVRVLDHFVTASEEDVPAGATVIEGDVCDPDAITRAMSGVDVAFHLAAVVDVEASVEYPLSCHETNTTATLALLDRARETDTRVVLASSAAVYGDPATVPVPETAATSPQSPYGVAKLAADLYARRYHDLYGLPTVALRFFNVYGPPSQPAEPSGVVRAFLEQASDGGPIRVHGDGEQTRDFVHVSDVVRALHLAARTDHVGEAFNVGTGERTSVRSLAATVRAVVDADVSLSHTRPREGDVTHSCADVGKARAGLGFEPTVPLHDGLRSAASGFEP